MNGCQSWAGGTWGFCPPLLNSANALIELGKGFLPSMQRTKLRVPFVILNHYPTPIRDQFPQRKSSVPLVVTHLNGTNYLAKISGEWWEIQAISIDKARLQAQQLEKISQTLLINPC